MENTNYKTLLKDYDFYSHTAEAVIVHIVRKYVDKIETKSKWIDVVDYDFFGIRGDKKAFNYLVIELFRREINPAFPNEKSFTNKSDYARICKALTWEASHQDIELQREKGKRGPMYLIICPVRNKNRGKKYIKAFPFWNEEYGGFDHTGNVPTTTIYRDVDMDPDWDYVLTGFVEINDQKFKMIKDNYYEFIHPRIINARRVIIDWFLEDYQLAKSKLKKLEEKKKTKPKVCKSQIPKKNV